MPDRPPPAPLPPVVADRVDAFIKRLERLRVEEQLALAARPLDDDAYRRALADAEREAERAGLADATAKLRHDVANWVIALFNRSTVQPGWYEANWGRPGSVEDRANLARSVGDAVVAVALGDALSDDTAAELLGPWADLAG